MVSCSTSRASIQAIAHQALDDYEAAITALFSASTFTESFAAESLTEDHVKRVLECDEKLQAVLKELESHQRFQALIEEAHSATQTLESLIRNTVSGLSNAVASLNNLVALGRAKLSSIALAERSRRPFNDYVSYGNKIASFTSAPPEALRQQPGARTIPPYPTETTMRSGVLYAHQERVEEFCESVAEKEGQVATDRADAGAEEQGAKKATVKNVVVDAFGSLVEDSDGDDRDGLLDLDLEDEDMGDLDLDL